MFLIHTSDLGTEIVTIFVGPKRKEFLIHKRLLCKKVEYFDKMFKGGFKEAEETTSYMPEDSPNTFSLFVRWLYRNDFPKLAKTAEQGNESCKSSDIMSLYFLAHKMCLEVVADRCMDILIDFHVSSDQVLNDEQIVKAYENSMTDSAVRLYCSRQVHWILATFKNGKHSTMWYRDLLEKHEDMFTDLLVQLRNTSNKQIMDPRKAPRCDYHVHKKDMPCPTETDSKVRESC